LLGAVDYPRTLELMIESSFVVVPSLWEEPGCLAAREAMARGRPVLGTNLGVLPELVDASSGWLVEPNMEGIVAGLGAAFDAPLERMGNAARRRYEEHSSPAASLRTLLRVYAEVAPVRS
jgi:glycosyltransferase involved in cell wall biosynthesis